MMIAPVLQYNGPELDPVGAFAEGQQIAVLRDERKRQDQDRQREEEARQTVQGVLSGGGDLETAAMQVLPKDPKLANYLLQMKSSQLSNSQTVDEIARKRIEDRKNQIATETKMANGLLTALDGVQEEDQKQSIYKYYIDKLQEQGIDLPDELKSGYSEENVSNIQSIARLGQQMLDLDPTGMTSTEKEYLRSKNDPGFADFLSGQNKRELSGTEAIVERLMAEDETLTYSQALALAQGLARKGLDISGGKVVPLEGMLESTEAASAAEQTGKEKVVSEYAADIEENKVIGKTTGEAKTELADYKAYLPKLENTVSKLSELSKTATYTKAGQTWASLQRELGREVSQADIDRAAYIAVVDNEVLPLLRQTFGAAFTVAEGESLRATLGDPNATPEQKQAKLDAFIENKKSQIDAQQSKIDILQGKESSPAPKAKRRYNPETGALE